MRKLKLLFACLLMTVLGIGQMWGETVTYTVSSASAVTTTGTAPDGSLAALSGTGTLNSGFIQCTSGQNKVLTLSGFEGHKITAVTIRVKSNSSKGAGSFSVVAGSTTLASISDSKFNTANWNGAWNTTGVDKALTMTEDDYEIQDGENVVLTLSASANSLYIQSYTITYAAVGGGGDVTVKTLKSIAVSGMTTTYDQNAAFSFDGTCTATYSVTINDVAQADEEKIVTPTSVSAPDMTTTGNKTVTVSYTTEDDVTRETTYDITVVAAPTIVDRVDDIIDGCTYYVKGIRSAGIEYLKFDDSEGASVTGTSDASKANAIAITFTKVSDGEYQLTTPNGLYLTPAASNGKLTLSSEASSCNVTNQTKNETNYIRISTTIETTEWSIQKNSSGANFGGYKNTQNDITLVQAGTCIVKELSSIAVKTQPTKTSYIIDDAFDASGLVITATYDDASKEDIAYADNEDKFSFTGFSSAAAAAAQAITVTYGGKSTTFNVEIKNITLQSVTVGDMPTTISYTAGDTFDPAGLTVMGHYSDNSDAAITSGITWSYPDNDATLTAGQTSIRVVATVDEIASTAYTVNGLTVTAAPLVASWVAKDQSYENGQEITSATFGPNDAFTITFDKGSNNNAPKYYTTGEAVRAYNDNSFTLSSTVYKFTQIVVTFASGEGSNAISTNVDTYENGTWTGNSKEVVFTIGGTNGHRRIASITVTYVEALPSVETPTISPDGGDFITAPQTVTITCATDGAEIHYTLDGTDPTNESATYTEALSLTETKTVKAIAIKDGMDNSAIASATFTKIEVKTVTDALSAAVNEVVYVSGTITSITEVNTTHGNATYVISDIVAGVPTNQMIVYRGKYLNNANFTSVDQLHEGDVVLVKGTISQHDSKNQLAAGNILQSISAPAVAAPSFTPDGGGFVVSASVSLTCVTAGATIYYTTDGTTPDNTKNAYASAIPLTETTTIKAVAIKNSESSMVVERTFTKTNPMTVAAAYDALDNDDPISDAAVEGIVYKVDRCTANGNAQYWISDDGTESTKVIEIYNGYGLDGANFADADGIQVGDKVIVFGTLKIYYNKNSEEVCREFDSGSRLLSLTRKTVTGVAVTGTPSKTSYKTGQAFDPAGLTVTVTYDDNSQATVAVADCGWEITPATFTEAGTNKSVSVKATYNEVQSPAFAVEGLTVTAAPTFKASDHEWQLVTSGAQLVAGKYYVIASTAQGKVMSNTISNSIAGEIAATFADGVIAYNAFGSSQSADAAGVAVLQLGGEEGAWTLTEVVAEDALLGATAAKNIAWGSGTTTWSISIASDNDATIQNGTSSYGRFLHNVNNTRFTTYTSNTSVSMLLPQLYVWAEKVYKLRYDANGGENAPAAQPAVAGEAIVTDAVPTYEDHIFTGWNTLTDGNGDAKAAGDVIDLSAGDVTLYAQWRDPVSVTISYDANEGTGEMVADADQVEGSTYTIKANAFERDGYLFAGWKAYDANDVELTITNGKFTVPATDVTVKAQWQSATDSKWVLVENLSQLANGDKVIIAAADYDYALGAASGSVRTNVAVTKTGKLLSVPGSATELILGRNGNDFTFKDGTKYLNWTSGNNLTTSDEVNNNSTWTITIENNVTTIANKATADRKIQYNASSPRFAAYTGTQQAVVIYKYLDIDPEDATSGYERVDLVLSGIGTICLPYDVKASDRFGGVFYMPSHKTSGFANFIEETGTLRAGKAYIFVAENEFIRLKFSGIAVSEPLSNVADTRGLIGTFTGMTAGSLTDKYVIADNKLRKCGSGAYLNANRAYLDLDAMPEEELTINEPANAPARRRLGVSGSNNMPTGMDELNVSERPVKVMMDGQMFIIRGEKMYDATGKLVK